MRSKDVQERGCDFLYGISPYLTSSGCTLTAPMRKMKMNIVSRGSSKP